MQLSLGHRLAVDLLGGEPADQIVAGIGPAIWPDTLLGVLVALLANNVAVVISGALTTPFSAGVAALQYLDQRIRKEGYDIQLIAQVSVPVPGPIPGAPSVPQA